MPPVDTNFQFETLRSRNVPHDARHRHIDRQTSRGQKPDIPPRSSSLKIHSRVTPDISTILPIPKAGWYVTLSSRTVYNYLSQPLDMKGVPSNTCWMSHSHKCLHTNWAWENKISPPSLNHHMLKQILLYILGGTNMQKKKILIELKMF